MYEKQMSECIHCGDQPAVKCRSATAYAKREDGKDPNPPLWLCYDCREEYYDHWADMWEEYRVMVMGGIY